MAHLPDGVLSLPVLAAGAAVATAGCAWGLRRLDSDRIPHAAMAAAACFVAALVHFPVGVGSVHLILNGLAGVVLGWAAFPVIAVATFLQMLMFGFGGFAALGVNIADMALPAVIAGGLFRLAVARFGLQDRRTALVAGAAGGLAPALTAAMISAALIFSGKEWTTAARLVFLTHAPVILIEAFVTAAAVGLALRVKPEIFAAPPPREITA